jgi:O-antigen ligase
VKERQHISEDDNMKRLKFSSLSTLSLSLPPAAMSSILVIYLVLSIALAFLMPISPLIGVLGALVINLIVVFFVQYQLALPFYILVAGPSVALSLSTTGIFSRIYIGNLLFALVMGIWVLKIVLPKRKSGQVKLELSLMVPLVALIAVGIMSIIYSRLFPDPTVSYSFTHSNVSITLVNLSEIVLLTGLPMFLLIVPGMVHGVRDVKLVLGAYLVVGLMYALGTIFAGPLGLYSKDVILGNKRPEVFGSVSSALGSLILLFACLALGQALYARRGFPRLSWSLLTIVYCIAVIMTFGRESWIALFLAVLLMVGLRIKKWSVLLIMLVPFLLLLIPGVSDFFDPSKVYGADRFKIWLDAIAIWQRSPYFGVGAGNYQFFDLTYGTDVVGIAHNQYLQVLAEMGVQGLLCLIWLIVAIGRISFKRFHAATTNMNRALTLAYLGFYVSLIFGGFFTSTFIPSAASGGGTGPFVEASYRWLFLGLILSLPSLQARQENMNGVTGSAVTPAPKSLPNATPAGALARRKNPGATARVGSDQTRGGGGKGVQEHTSMLRDVPLPKRDREGSNGAHFVE